MWLEIPVMGLVDHTESLFMGRIPVKQFDEDSMETTLQRGRRGCRGRVLQVRMRLRKGDR